MSSFNTYFIAAEVMQEHYALIYCANLSIKYTLITSLLDLLQSATPCMKDNYAQMWNTTHSNKSARADSSQVQMSYYCFCLFQWFWCPFIAFCSLLPYRVNKQHQIWSKSIQEVQRLNMWNSITSQLDNLLWEHTKNS